MHAKIKVLLLGYAPSVVWLLQQHQSNYTITVQHSYPLDHMTWKHIDPTLIVFALPDVKQCQDIRQSWPQLPLVVVSSTISEQHLITALDLGADDYIFMPFQQEEFLARLRALYRRFYIFRPQKSPEQRQILPEKLTSLDGKISLLLQRRRCFLDGKQVPLTPIEFNLLCLLLLHQGQPLTYRFLLQHVWGPGYENETRYVRVFIHQLRKKIEPDPSQPRYIIVKTGHGYMFHTCA